MPRFMVMTAPGYWDNFRLHPVGTVLEIAPEDYPKQLSASFKGMDSAAEEAVAKVRKLYAEYQVEQATTNNAAKPIKVVSGPTAEVAVVVPGRSR